MNIDSAIILIPNLILNIKVTYYYTTIPLYHYTSIPVYHYIIISLYDINRKYTTHG